MKPKTSKMYLSLGLGVATALGVFLCQPARASILWDGDASHGTSVFGSLNIENNPGTITVVTDAQQGQVFKMVCFDNGSTKVRTEGSRMRNFQPVAGQTYWFGWKHKWGPLPTKCGKWQVLEQIHLSGTGASGGPVPFGLHVDGCDANMEFEYQDGGGTAHNFLVMAFPPLNSWHSFMYHEKWSESESDGYVEFWYDGTMKTLANGSTRYPSSWCFPNSTSYWKWGIYRSGSGGPIGTSTAYLWRPRAGTTQADVDPGGGGGGGGTTVSFEAENLSVTDSGTGHSTQSDVNSSNGTWISLDAEATGSWIQFTTGTVQAGTYSVKMMWKGNNNRGQLSLQVDGGQVGGTLDQYSSTQTYPTTTFGNVTFSSSGTHTVRLTVTGKNASSSNYVLSADKFTFTAQ